MTQQMKLQPDFFNFNKIDTPNLIPEGATAVVQMDINPGGVGDAGWLRRAKDGNSQHLYVSFKVVDGTYAGREMPQNITVCGLDHDTSISRSRKFLRAIIESARGISAKDTSEAAEQARAVTGWQDFHQLRFIGRIIERSAQGIYEARNEVGGAVTADQSGYQKPVQIDRSGLRPNPAVTPAQPTQQPMTAIERPDWAKD